MYPDNIISYSYSSVLALSAEGKINILGVVIRNESMWGTSVTVWVWINDKIIFEETENFK